MSRNGKIQVNLSHWCFGFSSSSACTSLISASAANYDKATIDMDAKAQLSFISMISLTPKKMACGMRIATFLPASMTQK